MKDFQQLPISISYRYKVSGRIQSLISTPDGYLFSINAEVFKLDKQLRFVWKKDLQAQYCNITVSPNNQFIALAGKDNIRIFDAEYNLLFTHFHRPWKASLNTCCFFSADNNFAWFATHHSNIQEDDILYVLDAHTFKIIDNISIPGKNYNAYVFHQTPNASQIMLEIDAGQDYATLYIAELVNYKIHLQELTQCHDKFIGSFSPNAKSFVMAPHYDEDMEVFSFPGIKKIASISQASIFNDRNEYLCKEEDSLDNLAFYLFDELIVAKTRFSRLLLIDIQMQCLGELCLEDCKIVAYNESDKIAKNSEEITFYEGEINSIFLANHNQLCVEHTSNEIRIYEFKLSSLT